MLSRISISRLAAVFLFILASSATSAQSALEQVEKDVQRLFETAKNSVVQIKAIRQNAVPPLAVGTGFFINDQGLILTSSEVVNDCAENDIQVIWGMRKLNAKRIGFDTRTNLGLIKIPANGTPALKFCDSENVRVGAMVVGVGFPLNSALCPEVGNVSSVDLGQIMKFFATSHIRSTVRVVEGQAGSPLLNTKGEVVGMIVAADTDGSHSYALPVSAIKKVQPDLEKYSQPRYGFVGIGINELTVDGKGNPLAEPKVIVERVYSGTSAEQAGVKKGDVVLKINGLKVSQAADVMNATYYLRVDDKITVTARNAAGQEKDFVIRIGPRPVAPAKPRAGDGIPVSQKQ